jgi:mono/diheme cytochrome c family protein
MNRSKSVLACLMSAAVMVAGCAATPHPAENRGRELVQANCQACHAVGVSDESRTPEAPPFRLLMRGGYRVSNLEEALVGGIGLGHPPMPEFRLSPSEVEAVVAYLQSIQSDR